MDQSVTMTAGGTVRRPAGRPAAGGRRILLGVMATAVVGALVLASAANGASRSETPATPVRQLGSGHPGYLVGVSASSSTDAWAIGYPNILEHWDGTSWSLMPLTPARTPQWRGVAAVSATDAWIFGVTASDPDKTLIEHWDGTSWTRLPSPSPSRDLVQLTALSAVSATDAWAVGSYFNRAEKRYLTLILHWDGTAWTRVPSPSPGKHVGAVNTLNGVSAVSATDAWAVGVVSKNGLARRKTLIEHWDGVRWTKVPSPSPGWVGRVGSYLNAVDATSPTDAWAVGTYKSGGRNDSLVEHWDGTRWTKVPSPGGLSTPPVRGDGRTSLLSVSSSSATDAWSVGFFRPHWWNEGLVAEHWDGARWRVARTDQHDAATEEALWGVSAVSADDAWAVGRAEDPGSSEMSTLIEHWDGTSWTRS